MIQQYYCKEKLHAGHLQRLKGLQGQGAWASKDLPDHAPIRGEGHSEQVVIKCNNLLQQTDEGCAIQ